MVVDLEPGAGVDVAAVGVDTVGVDVDAELPEDPSSDELHPAAIRATDTNSSAATDLLMP